MTHDIERTEVLEAHLARVHALDEEIERARAELAAARRHPRERTARDVLLFGLAGAVLGVVTWLETGTPTFAVLFPLLASTFGAIYGALRTLKPHDDRTRFRLCTVTYPSYESSNLQPVSSSAKRRSSPLTGRSVPQGNE